jgi:hypothetical protein
MPATGERRPLTLRSQPNHWPGDTADRKPTAVEAATRASSSDRLEVWLFLLAPLDLRLDGLQYITLRPHFDDHLKTIELMNSIVYANY